MNNIRLKLKVKSEGPILLVGLLYLLALLGCTLGVAYGNLTVTIICGVFLAALLGLLTPSFKFSITDSKKYND